MSSAKFTKGPWVAETNGCMVYTRAIVDEHRVSGYGAGSSFICDLNDHEYHEYSDPIEQLANARLIAAAPEMYEALRQCEQLLRTYGVDHKGARAALTKAEGSQ